MLICTSIPQKGFKNREEFIAWWKHISKKIHLHYPTHSFENLFYNKGNYLLNHCMDYKDIWLKNFLIWKLSQ